jgi:glycine/D-amino acid oxidase-like deaminating enzyme
LPAGGVEVDGGVIEADAVVVAMGPWSLLAAGWMVLPAVFGRRSPSLVYDTGTDIPADALFLDYHEDSGAAVTVEVFPRADGSTLITAFSDQALLPLDPAAVTPDPSATQSPQGDLRTAVADFPRGQNHRAASLFPSGHAGRPAADRQGAAERGRLRGIRP